MHGAGLGPEGEGIMNPIMAKWKRDKTGVGVEPNEYVPHTSSPDPWALRFSFLE